MGGFGAQRKRETEVVCLWCISNIISVLEEVGLQRFSKCRLRAGFFGFFQGVSLPSSVCHVTQTLECTGAVATCTTLSDLFPKSMHCTWSYSTRCVRPRSRAR